MFTIGTVPPEMSSKILKNRAVPRLLNRVVPQVHSPSPSLIVKAAREHLHIGGDVGRPTGALAGINTVQVYINCQRNQPRDRAGIKANFIAMPAVAGKFKKLPHTGVVIAQNLLLSTQSNWLMQQKYNGVNAHWKTAFFQAGYRFSDGSIADNVVDIGLHTSLEQQVDCP